MRTFAVHCIIIHGIDRSHTTIKPDDGGDKHEVVLLEEERDMREMADKHQR